MVVQLPNHRYSKRLKWLTFSRAKRLQELKDLPEKRRIVEEQIKPQYLMPEQILFQQIIIGAKKVMDQRIKVIVHIGAITLLILSVVFLHFIINQDPYIKNDEIYYPQIWFFDLLVNRYVVMDLGFTFLGIGFFIEFIMTFRPIKILLFENKNVDNG